MKNIHKEWFVQAPWGKIALISYGNPDGYPVLLIHGRQDSSACFIPLLQLLPDNFYYAAMELPGCGKSDAFPVGVKLMRFTNVSAMDMVMKHLGWSEFYCIAHSLGTEVCCFYNAIYPNRIKKQVLIDPIPAWNKIQIRDFDKYMEAFYEEYYDNYRSQNVNSKFYSRVKAVDAVKRGRGVDSDQAMMLLSRNLIQVGDDMFKLSWDRRQKYPAPWNLENEYYSKLFSKSPPTLLINALHNGAFENSEQTKKLMRDIQEKSSFFVILDVDGDHDVHFKYPERIVDDINRFLLQGTRNKAKL